MTIKSVDAKTLETWLKNGEAVLVDVREPAEHAAENISCAHLLPLSQVHINLLPEFKNKKLVIHCRSGKRSLSACELLVSQDPSLEVYNLEGGIMSWSSLGCKVESSGKFFLPLDRQVQLTIGLGVFLGSVLGYFVNPIYFLLSGFFGAGLIFAALSGTCALACLLTKMPWNKACGKSSCAFVKK